MPNTPHRQMSLIETLTQEAALTPPHVIVKARAGTGKTTTLIEGVKLLKGIEPSIVPSEQQAAIWQSLLLSPKQSTVALVAFGRAIAANLKHRLPKGVGAVASTLHGMGFKAVANNFQLLPGDDGVNKFRVHKIISILTKTSLDVLREQYGSQLEATTELVNLCKANLYDGKNHMELEMLCDLHDIDTGDSTDKIYALIPRILERCKKVHLDRYIDYTDMIWLPVVLNLPIPKYDILLVDEAQDLNLCQQAMALRAGRRLFLCGDPQQSIFAFAGADATSMPRMDKILQNTASGCTTLMLTKTRRCGRLIVEEAKKIVPDFEWSEDNGEGRVSAAVYLPAERQIDFRDSVNDNDMILCRLNSVLVTEVFKFIWRGRKANIKGKDIGKGLIKLVEKIQRMKSKSPEDTPLTAFISNLQVWAALETSKELAREFPSDGKIQGIIDRKACLNIFLEEVASPDKLIPKIEAIFTDDDNDGIMLSSIHKAKGLEADRVFLLVPPGATLPSKRATKAIQLEQEMNLLYVAQTRAKKELIYVS